MQNPAVAIALTSALRNVGQEVASKTTSLVVRVDSTAKESAGASGKSGAGKELADVARLAASVIQKFASQATAEEKSGSAKVMAIIAAVVLVVVACVIAAFTFGAAGALVSLAVIAAAAIIGSAAAAAKAAGAVNHPLAPALLALLAKASAAVQAFERERAADAAAARRRALREIMQALRSLEALAPPVRELVGPCQADPEATFSSGQQANQALGNVIACLRRRGFGGNSEGLSAIAALESLQIVAAQALSSAKPTRLKQGPFPDVSRTPTPGGPVPIPYPNTANTKTR